MGVSDKDTSRHEPSHLYRYFPLPEDFHREKLERIRRVIIDRKLYFCSPARFNDPFDCKSEALHFGKSKQTWEAHLKGVIRRNHPEWPRNQRRSWVKEHITNKDYEKIDTGALKSRIQKRANEHGVLCLTESNDDLLMWAHYGSGHCGCCMQFSLDYRFFGVAVPVEYQQDFPLVDALTEPEDLDIKSLLFTKAICWKYEKEWRIFKIGEGNQEHEYPHDALEAIYLGLQISPSNKQFILECVASLPNHPKVFQAKKKKREYALEFEPVGLD